MQGLAGVTVVVVAICVLGAGCSEESRYISEEQAAEYAQRNREVADALPVPEGARLVEEEETDCAGALRHDANACRLRLDFETSQPQIEVMEFYRQYFRDEGWLVVVDDPTRETEVWFGTDELRAQVFLSIPLDLCPNPDIRFQEYIACQAAEIRQDDGKVREFSMSIHPT
jgi:hypothetical protein